MTAMIVLSILEAAHIVTLRTCKSEICETISGLIVTVMALFARAKT